MKLAAVVVLYEPEEIGLEKVISNIKSYSPCCEKLYIVDNSQKTHEKIKDKFTRAHTFQTKMPAESQAPRTGAALWR